MAAQCLNGLLFLLLAGALLTLHGLVLHVSAAVTCYEGVRLQTPVTDNSTIKLREGELLIIRCFIPTGGIHRDLELNYCTKPGLLKSISNTTWFCEITGNYTTIEVYGTYEDQEGRINAEILLDFDVETYNLEQCLADARETPSPCTTPPLTDPATSTSTSPTISTTKTTTATTEIPTTITPTTDPNDSRTPIEVTDPVISGPDRFRQDVTNVENEEIKEYSLYSVVCVLGVIVLVQFWVIVLLAVKLCCRKKRGKCAEEGETRIEQQQELRRMSRPSSDRDNESVITNRASIDAENATNDLREEVEEGGAATVTEPQEEELDQQNSNVAREAVITNGGSIDSVNDSNPTSNSC